MSGRTAIVCAGIFFLLSSLSWRAAPTEAGETNADPYMGSQKCSSCHSKQKKAFREHGHPGILRPVIGGQIPEGMPVETPEGITWKDISYVVGGAKNYARFLDSKGFVVTGDKTQWSFYGKTLTGFKTALPRGTLKYTCIKCHSVGWKESGSYVKGVKNALPGIPGSWFENGVGCESCHGPGSKHVNLGNKKAVKQEGGNLEILIDKRIEMCGGCHNRNSDHAINIVSGDLLQSRQQYAELMRSRKGKEAMSCLSCHDPHGSSSLAVGFTQPCIACHDHKEEIKLPSMAHLACIDCHMPFAVRGAYDTMVENYHRGDSRSHLFGISHDPSYAINDRTSHAAAGKDGLVRLTVEMACYSCHQSGEAHDMTRNELLKSMGNIH